jgi:hypothetical protein
MTEILMYSLCMMWQLSGIHVDMPLLVAKMIGLIQRISSILAA